MPGCGVHASLTGAPTRGPQENAPSRWLLGPAPKLSDRYRAWASAQTSALPNARYVRGRRVPKQPGPHNESTNSRAAVSQTRELL